MVKQTVDQQNNELPLDTFLKRPKVAKFWGWITRATTVVEDIHSRLHNRRALYVIVISILSLVILALGLSAVWLLELSGSVYTLIATLVAAPPLFVVWMFRNEDKQRDIENARTDNLQKDFHQIQKWATKSEERVSDSLQIAAIHQLKPYFVGDYDESFRRPVYEIYRVLLNGWTKLGRDSDGNLSNEALDEIKTLPLPPYILAVHTVIREILQKEGAWRDTFPDDSRPLRQLNLLRANLIGAHLEKANLEWAFLEGADIVGAHLEGANLSEAHLQRADLSGAHLEGANLSEAHLQGADLSRAHLEGARLQWTHIEGANFEWALDYNNAIFYETIYSDGDNPTEWWNRAFDPKKHNTSYPKPFIHIDDWKKRQEEMRKKRNSS